MCTLHTVPLEASSTVNLRGILYKIIGVCYGENDRLDIPDTFKIDYNKINFIKASAIFPKVSEQIPLLKEFMLGCVPVSLMPEGCEAPFFQSPNILEIAEKQDSDYYSGWRSDPSKRPTVQQDLKDKFQIMLAYLKIRDLICGISEQEYTIDAMFTETSQLRQAI